MPDWRIRRGVRRVVVADCDQLSTCSHAGRAANASGLNTCFAQARKLAYSRASDDFEQVIAQRPLAGTGIAARFFHCFIPIAIITAKGIRVVKASICIDY